MAKPKPLKVYRTPIGFHDAYVATATKKAALEAWGSHRNLFALGEAEQVTNAKLMRAPLASPGTIIKVTRGTMAKQLKALPPEEKPEAKSRTTKSAKPRALGTKKKPVPRPSRAAVDRAEAARAAVQDAHTEERAKIDDEIERLRDRREALVPRQAKALAASDAAVDHATSVYGERLSAWLEQG